jgi:hypothetical protein
MTGTWPVLEVIIINKSRISFSWEEFFLYHHPQQPLSTQLSILSSRYTMKFSQSTLFAILATSAFVSAAPVGTSTGSELTFVKRSDTTEILEILSELQHLTQKRELIESDEELEILNKRADSAIGNLISAFASSGIIGEVWSTLTTDPAIKAQLGGLIKGALQTALVQGPALIKAIWNSGLITKLFNSLLNDTELRSAFLGVAKSLFSTALNLLGAAKKPATTPAATPAAAAPAAATGAYKREVITGDDEFLDKRDLASIIGFVVTEIKNSGIVSGLINKVLADPQKSIAFLTSALKNGVVIFEDVYGYAKSSGLLASGLNYLKAHGGQYASAIASFLSGQISSGKVSPSEINNAPTGTSTASTGAATGSSNVMAQLAAAYGGGAAASGAAAVPAATPAAAVPAAAAAPATTAAAGGNSDLASVFAAAQNAPPNLSTLLVKRRNY